MTRVLVPVEILEGKTVSPGLMTLLSTVEVTVLGYYVVPEQTPPDQARHQFEDRATAALDDLSDEFETAGTAADHRLVFTRDREQTIDRIADEVGAEAFAISGVAGDIESLLVSLSGDVATDRILAFVEQLVDDRDIRLTLLRAADDSDDSSGLDSAAERLRERGLGVETEPASTADAFDALMAAALGHDAIVMGENARSLRSLLFGEDAERVAAASVGPVVVVRSLDQVSD